MYVDIEVQIVYFINCYCLPRIKSFYFIKLNNDEVSFL